MIGFGNRDRAGALIAHGSAAIVCGALLYAVGQPIFTDDLWWHLALGRVFLANGPWLATDPLLFAPAGLPSPASWLAEIALAVMASAAGFVGLRVLHVGIAAAILALAWSLLHRASRSAAIASAGTAAFASLAAYRLVQLRPELVTIAASLLVYRTVVADPRPFSRRKIAAVAIAAAVWANAHAGFVLGLLVLGAACGGLALSALLQPSRPEARARAVRMAAALAAATVATLANPDGIRAHLAYFEAGSVTPALARIVDEWKPLSPFSLPTTYDLPSPLNWALCWALALGVAIGLARAIADYRAQRAFGPLALAEAGVALMALALIQSAVRFTWLGLFPLCWLVGVAAPDPVDGPETRAVHRRPIAAGAASLLIALCFFAWGDWRAITRSLTWKTYAVPYPASKYYAEAIWMLADSGVRGHLYCDYYLGGFAGYWLAPEVKTIANGTLNVPSQSLDALGAIARRRGQLPGESFPQLLDRLGVDLFLGTRLPQIGPTGSASLATTAHLEDTPGWLLIFRNADSALYLRTNETARENLDRIARFYAERGVPFDRVRGFEIDAVLRDAPDWAVAHGVVPPGFAHFSRVSTAGAHRDVLVLERLAALYAVLGRYEHAIAIDREILGDQPGAVRARRRLTWCLLRIGRYPEAVAAAGPLEARPERDLLSHRIARAARRSMAPEAAADPRAVTAIVPLFSAREASWLVEGIAAPIHRAPRN